jgi:hypothetical protein
MNIKKLQSLLKKELMGDNGINRSFIGQRKGYIANFLSFNEIEGGHRRSLKVVY